MADRSKARGKPARKQAVIDIGDGTSAKAPEPAEQPEPPEPPEPPDGEDADEPRGVDDEMVESAIDVGAIADLAAEADADAYDDREERAKTRGSLALRDPMAAYMAEVRRYPLLSQ